MTPWIELFEHPLVHRLGWVLLHFLWQGTAVALVWAVFRYLLRGQDARVRYGVACLLLGLMAIAPIVTFRMLPTVTAPRVITVPSWSVEVQASVASASTASPTRGSILLAQSAAERAAAGIELALPWLVVVWWAGVCGLSMRLLRGYWSVRLVASRHTRPLPAEWEERIRELRRRLRISRPVLLLESAVIEVPAVLGWFRPMVLVPASSLSGLTPAQLELILAHELAHIRRHDHWVNLVQVLIETVLFYHPAVWWLSRDIRKERELCCDDLAVATCGNRLAYARALSALEGLRSRPEAMAMGADGGSLLDRIRRIVGVPTSESAVGWRQPVGGALIGLGLLLFAGGLGSIALSAREYSAVCRVAFLGWGEQRGEISDRERWGELPRMDPHLDYFLQTEMARMLSRPVLTEVANRLGLGPRWGNETEPLQLEAVVTRLKRQVSIRRLPESSLIAIRVTSRTPGEMAREAAEIANMIAEVYLRTRPNHRQQLLSESGVKALEKELAKQDMEVRRQRDALDQMRQERNISDLHQDATTAQFADPETLRRLRSELILLQASAQAQTGLIAMLKELQARGEEQLRRSILTLVPDSDLSRLFQDLWTAEASLAKLRVQYGSEHSEVRGMDAMRAELDRRVNNRVEGILDGMELRLASLKAQERNLERAIESLLRQEGELFAKYRDYFVVKRGLESAEKVRDAIHLRKMQEQVDLQIPRPGMSDFEIIEPAIASDQPVRPRLGLGLTLCAAGLLSSLGGLVVRVGGGSPSGRKEELR
jgi:beta-lactamase regulating signal transducer with metallopeptidase domain